MLGEHTVKAWSVTQGLVSLSSGESEYYGMVKGGSVALGLRGIMWEMGLGVSIDMYTDASAPWELRQEGVVGK